MNPFNYTELLIRLLPHTILIVGALIVIFCDQASARHSNPSARSNRAVFFGAITVILAILVLLRQAEFALAYNAMLQLDDFVRAVQTGLLIFTRATLLIPAPATLTATTREYGARS